jgi:CheY-like chemotaxis protein
MILNVGEKVLSSMGYTVLRALSGEEAIELYKENRDGIDLIILDMIMPGIGGGETFDRLRMIDPRVRVLLSSGYSVDGQATEILQRGCNGFIQKPFDIKQLSQKIRVVLE